MVLVAVDKSRQRTWVIWKGMTMRYLMAGLKRDLMWTRKTEFSLGDVEAWQTAFLRMEPLTPGKPVPLHFFPFMTSQCSDVDGTTKCPRLCAAAGAV